MMDDIADGGCYALFQNLEPIFTNTNRKITTQVDCSLLSRRTGCKAMQVPAEHSINAVIFHRIRSCSTLWSGHNLHIR